MHYTRTLLLLLLQKCHSGCCAQGRTIVLSPQSPVALPGIACDSALYGQNYMEHCDCQGDVMGIASSVSR
jgi:hypothetical protein